MPSLIAREVIWMMRKKSFKLVFWGMLLWVTFNYVQVLLRYWGTDVSVLPGGMEFRLASTYDFNWMPLLTEIFPFVLVLPAAFSFLNDEDTGTSVYLKARLGQGKYYLIRIMTIFCATFLAFAVPLLLEVLLFLVAFPGGRIGDVSNISPYLKGHAYENMLFHEVYYIGDVPYAILGALTWGVTAAILACFAAAVSTWGLKLKVILFLPAYLLLNGLSLLGQAFAIPFDTGYWSYLIHYDAQKKSTAGFLGMQAVLLILTALLLFVRIKANEQRGWPHGES